MKDTKVFRVHTGIVENNGEGVPQDNPNFASYVEVAKDAEMAIKQAKKRFVIKSKEYVESVDRVITLDY